MVWPLMDVVANIDLWALSPWITGQVIVVDGSFNCKLLLIDPDMPLFTSELLCFKGGCLFNDEIKYQLLFNEVLRICCCSSFIALLIVFQLSK